MLLYATLQAKGLCLLLGLEPTGSSSWKGRESLLQNPEPEHGCLPPVPCGWGSGVPGVRGQRSTSTLPKPGLLWFWLLLGNSLVHRYLFTK